MSLRKIAELVPAEYRREILTTNMISRCQANRGDSSMQYLFTIYKNYVSPGEELDYSCGVCLERILNNWIGLQPDLVQLEKESQLLKSL